MDVTLDAGASRLLALLDEADREPVTLDELAIAGVDDPARALHALELAGFAVDRLIDLTGRADRVQCVRLARPGRAPEPEAAQVATPRLPAPPAPEPAPGWVPEPAVPVVEQPVASGAQPAPPLAAPTAPATQPAHRPIAQATPPPASGRAGSLLIAADGRPMLLALVALLVALVVGRAVSGRAG